MKGLSAVIAAIILLLISIALASFAFTFFARMPVKVSSAAEEEAKQFIGDLTPFRIDTVDNGNLYIRNLASSPIEGTDLALFVDNNMVNIVSDNLTPNSVGLVNISDGILASGSYKFKLTTRLIEKSETLSVPKNNVAKDPSFGEAGREPLDIVLILDKSESMNEITNGTRKIDDLKSAAVNFVDMIDIQDRIALVIFSTHANDTVRGLPHPLTFNKTAIKNKILDISPEGGTFIGYAIGNATFELINHSRNAKKVGVLITDGRDNSQFIPPQYVDQYSWPLVRAAEAAAHGIVIYTIGLGSDVNETMLMQIAGLTHGAYYFAAIGPQLQAIFTEIGEQLSVNWVKTGNTTIGNFGSYCSSPNVCVIFNNTVYPDSALYQNVKLVFPGSYNVEAAVSANISGSICSNNCPRFSGETCAHNDARIRLMAFDTNDALLGGTTSSWGSTIGMGWINITKTWTTPSNTKTVRFQIEPGDCCSSCSINNIYVDDASIKISKT